MAAHVTAPGAELVPATERQPTDIDSWVEVIRPVINLSEHVAETAFVPKALRSNAPAIAAAILHGRELGLPPMTALSQTHVIDGRPTISAEGQRGLVLAAGHLIEFQELTDATAVVRGRRNGSDTWTPVTWTLDRARRAGLLGNPAWQKYPRAMLAARASAELCRLVFPDVVHGMAAAEEMDGYEPPAIAGTTPAKRPTRPVERQTPAAPPPHPPDPEPAPTEPVEPPPPPEPIPGPEERDNPLPEPPVTPAQLKMLGVVWSRFGADDDTRRRLTAQIVGRDLNGTTKNLTLGEARHLIDRLTAILRDLADENDTMAERVPKDDAMRALTEWIDEHD